MSAAMRRWQSVFTLLLCLSVATVVAADDDFLDHYKNGLAAIARGDWAAAEEQMRQAAAGKANEDPRLTRRLYFKRYLPHYFLGRARFETGDCAGAIRAWEESLRQGVIRQYDEHKLLTRDIELCKTRLAALAEAEAALKAARQRLEAAEAAARRVRDLASKPELASLWGEGDPSLESHEGQAKELLASARQKLPTEAASAELPRIREAMDLASQALSSFEEVEQKASELGSTASAERAGQLDGLKAQLRVAATLLASQPFSPPDPTEVARRRSELEAAMAAAEKLEAGASAAELGQVSQALLTAQSRLKKALAAPPEVLNRAAEAFFRGDYAKTLELLEGAELGETRALAHAALFRAAAHFGLWAASGELDTARLDAARAEIAACRVADPKRIPTTTTFSPRFVELFTRESSGPSP